MALAMINFRMDEGLKKNMEKNLQSYGADHDSCIYSFCIKRLTC